MPLAANAIIARMDYITDDGRSFVLVGERKPYGPDKAFSILVWYGNCAKCGEPFEVTTPVNFGGTHAFAQKHCKAHRLGLRARIENLVRWNRENK